MLQWYEIKPPSQASSDDVLKSLRKHRLMVRAHDSVLYACVASTHVKWLGDVCRDFGVSFVSLEEIPRGIRAPTKEVYITPCGEEFYDPVLYSRHFRECPDPKCIEKVKSGPERPKRARTVAKLEPGQELTLDGVISSVEVVKDQMWEEVEKLDRLLTDLKAYRDAKEKLSELSEEATKRMNAVRLLLNDHKL